MDIVPVSKLDEAMFLIAGTLEDVAKTQSISPLLIIRVPHSAHVVFRELAGVLVFDNTEEYAC